MDYLSLLGKIFDYVRIVNPTEKDVEYAIGDDKFHLITHSNCYDVWQRRKVCDNCISIRAINENKTIVKFEVNAGRTFIVIAAPYDMNGTLKAVELVKDVTENNIFDVFTQSENTNYSEIISDLNQYIITDELTQIYNKRFVHEHLPIDIKNAYFENKSLCIVMADIDHFKLVNDTYGHPNGDIILEHLGGIFKSSIRGDLDWVARYGGEEFLFVFRGLDEKGLQALCDRIRCSVEDYKFYLNDELINITISMGGIVIEAVGNIDEKVYLTRADQLLYQAKELGRNRCEIEKFEVLDED